VRRAVKLSVQTDNATLLAEILRSPCDGLRFGSEFCEQLLPPLVSLERAYELSLGAGKTFAYVTPRLSNG